MICYIQKGVIHKLNATWIMASRALRRRIHHGDANGLNHEHSDRSESDALSEPLLENYRHDENYSEVFPFSFSTCVE